MAHKHRVIFYARPHQSRAIVLLLAFYSSILSIWLMIPGRNSPDILLFSSSIFGRGAWSIRVIHAQPSAIRLFTLQLLHSVHRALDINEIGMCETSGLSGSSINGDTHVDHIADTAEEVVEITVGHLEGHVADEEGL